MMKLALVILPSLLSIAHLSAVNQIVFEDCGNYNGLDSCKSGSDISYGGETDKRMWQAKAEIIDTFNVYGDVQGYARIIYSADRNAATVKAVYFKRDNSVKVLCNFGDDAAFGEECEKEFTKKNFEEKINEASDEEKLNLELEGIVVRIKAGGSVLTLDPIYFIWQNPEINSPPETENGQKGAIVELFGWPFEDVAQECEFLGKAGYMGVKIFPATEHVESYHYLQNGELNPWPVSYRLQSRFGSREVLRKMIVQCRKNGVRVYADAVVNHMTGGGNDVLTHRINRGSCIYWGAKNGTASSPFYTHSFTFADNEYTHERPALEFPAVPYHAKHFHCDRPMNDWANPFNLNYGWLSGLSDLNTEVDYVQQRISDYLTDLISIGFSGFRVDAAKHIRPADLGGIFGKFFKNMGGRNLPSDFITWLEVILGGEARLLACEDNPYNYYTFLDKAYQDNGIPESELGKLKIWSSDYPKEFPICGHWKIPASRFVVQNDDHDQQNPGSSSRDMADKGSVLIKEKNVERHRMFEKQLFERTDGDWKIKAVLSSYSFMNTGAQGYPDGKSDCKMFKGNPYESQNCKTVPFQKAYDPSACGYSVFPNGQWKEGTYTRVHRDREIIASMRKWMGFESVDVSNEDLGLPDSC